MKETKIFIAGIQGSGKTYFAANKLIPMYDNPIIYGVHPIDYKDCKGIIVVPSNYTTDELDRTAAIIKMKALKGECDCFVIDEADWFLCNNLEGLKKYSSLYDLIINHRHYKKGYPTINDEKLKGLGLIFITRRPQSIPTEVMESCEHIFCFAIEGDNVMKKFKSIHPKFEELIPRLSKNKHNFIYKKLGNPPHIYTDMELVDRNERGLN